MTQILASESATTAATKTIDINVKSPISRMIIRMKGTNNGSTPTAHPIKMLSTIELVDGSDVLYSLSGIEAAALNFYENGELPFFVCEYENDIECCATVQLNFGRFLWDRELALDPSRFKNLQLKITHNKALGGSAPDAATLAVFAAVFEDNPPTPKGFLMSKEIYSYSLTASAHEYIDLPTDYDYRFVLLQSYDTTYPPNTQFGNLKFTLDHDREVLINNISMTEFIKIMPPMDKVEENFAGLGTGSAVSYYQAGTYECYGVGVGRSASQTTLIVGQPSGSRIQVTNDASESFSVYETGYVPFGAMDLLIADKMDAGSWLNARRYGSVRLDITAGSGASGTAYVVLQQLRNY